MINYTSLPVPRPASPDDISLKELVAHYKKIKPAIKARIAEFRSVIESGSDHDFHVLTDTLTHTNHLDVKDEHGGEIHLGDEDHNITSTIDITSTRHGDNKSVDVSRQGQKNGNGGANTRQNLDNSGNNNNQSGQRNNSGRGDRRKP